MSNRPLEGIRVLDLSRLLPGPFLTMILADMGADVIKVEDPRIGDYMRNFPPMKAGMSGRFLAVNRNKRSLALDLKSDAGREALLRMVKTADVVVETFRPGVMDKLGVGFEALKAHNDKIILCSISGYGQDGPYKKRAGHDLNYIGLAGVLAMGGQRNGAPMLPGVQIADVAGGAMWGVTALLGALVGRERGGGGAHLDISMTEGSLAMLATELGNMDAGAVEPSRGKEMLNGAIAPYRVYECKDGKYFSVGSLEPKFWFALNGVLGRKADMSEITADHEKQEQIAAELAEIFKTKTRDEWTEVFASADCCAEPVLEPAELPEHPLHKARKVFFTMEYDGGEMLQVRTPVGDPPRTRIAPRLGEHSAEVLGEFGFDDAEIRTLLAPPK